MGGTWRSSERCSDPRGLEIWIQSPSSSGVLTLSRFQSAGLCLTICCTVAEKPGFLWCFPLSGLLISHSPAAASDGCLTMLHFSKAPTAHHLISQISHTSSYPLTLSVSIRGLGVEERGRTQRGSCCWKEGDVFCRPDPQAAVPGQRKEGQRESRIFLMPSVDIEILYT